MSYGKKERMYYGITYIEDDLIEEALKYSAEGRRNRWLAAVSIAASLILIAGLILFYQARQRLNQEQMTTDPSLAEDTAQEPGTNQWTDNEMTSEGTKMQEITSESGSTEVDSGSSVTEELAYVNGLPKLPSFVETDAMGFEGLMFYDISESGTKNPWSTWGENSGLTELPVYRNLAYTDAAGAPLHLPGDEMMAKAEAAAEFMGYNITESTYYCLSGMKETAPEEEDCYCITVQSDGGSIKVNGNGSITVLFAETAQNTISIVDTDNESEDRAETDSMDEFEKNLSSYAEQYQELIKLHDAVFEVWGDYTFDGDRLMNCFGFSREEGLIETMLNYNFNRVEFLFGDSLELSGLRFGNVLESAEKLGDYPVITEEEALQYLLEGDYYTTVPEDYLTDDRIQEEDVCKTELVYQTGNDYEFFEPYYRFYVQLDDHPGTEKADGLILYGIYYVPAIQKEYLID